jgi:hypothetical protein
VSLTCQNWCEAAAPLLGEAPAKAVETAKSALSAAAAEDVIDVRQGSNMISRISSVSGDNVQAVAKSVQRVADEQNPIRRLVALGQLDQSALLNVAALVKEIAGVLDASLSKAKSRIAAAGGGDLEALTGEINSLFVRLEKAVRSIDPGGLPD